MFVPFTVSQGTMIHFMHNCLIDSKALLQLVDDKPVFIFVSGVNAHRSLWLELEKIRSLDD